MRKRRILGITLAGLGILAVTSAACGDKKGAIMLAINTDMKAPKDVNAVSVTISANGQIIHSAIGRVTPQGEVTFPASLAIAEGDESKSVRVRVMAFQDRKARVLRDVRTSIPKGGRVAMLRIPLNFVNDASAVGDQLPPGVVPDPIPGTGGTTTGGGTDSGTTSGDVSSSGGTVSTGEFDFFNQFQTTCPDPIAQTVIDGECKDNYIDPETLPDYDEAALGNSADPGSCFDVVKCFGGATTIGQASGGSDTGTGAPRPPGGAGDGPGSSSGSSGGSGGTADAGGGSGFKTITPRAITFDSNACTLQLNGANAARLNLALVTPDTGECVKSGECYVPIDKGAGGWREEGGTVRLPAFVCTLIRKRPEIKLAQTVDLCAAKEEKNPICASKPGDLGVPDGGPGTPKAQLVVKADFPTTVASGAATLGWAGADGFYFASLSTPSVSGFVVKGIPPAKLPWRIEPSMVGPLLVTNGTGTAYTINGGTPDSTVTTISVSNKTVHGLALGVQQLVWAVAVEGQGVFSSLVGQPTATKATFVNQTPPNATALTKIGDNAFLVGELSGSVRFCQLAGSESFCANPIGVGKTRVDAIVPRPSPESVGYVATQDEILAVRVAGQSLEPMTRKASLAPVITGVSDILARGLVATPSCIYFASNNGLEYAVDKGGVLEGGVLAGNLAGPVVGVTLGTEPGKLESGPQVYFTVYAPTASGGGIYKIEEPAACRGGSVIGDGGTGTEASVPDAGPRCTPANCADGCCIGGSDGDCIRPGAGAPLADPHCGLNGATCVDCTKTFQSCNGFGQCTSG